MKKSVSWIRVFWLVLMACCFVLCTACEQDGPVTLSPQASPPSSDSVPPSDSTPPPDSGGEPSGLPERVWAYESPDEVSADRFDFAQEELDAAAAAVRSELEELGQQEYTISLTIGEITPSPEKTAQAWAMYFSPESEQFADWTQEDMLTRFLAVEAVYDAEYDGTKTFLPSGHLSATYYLVRENGVWTVWSQGGGSAGT